MSSEWITDRKPTKSDAGYCEHMPKKYLVEPCGNSWGVRRRWSIEERYSSEPFQALDIPTREAAERIAAIYEEVLP